MGQIVSSAAKPKRCNANQLSQVPTPAAGEYILVSSDNSMNAAGQGNFDCYIVGDGQTAATELEIKKVDKEFYDVLFSNERKNIFSDLSFIKAYVDKNSGKVISYNTYRVSQPFFVNKGDKVEVSCTGSDVYIISTTNSPTIAINDYVTGKVVTTSNAQIRDYEYIADADQYVVICGIASSLTAIYVTHSTSLRDDVEDLSDEVEALSNNVAANTAAISSLDNRVDSIENNGTNTVATDSDTLLLQKKIEELGSYYYKSAVSPPVSYEEDDYLNNKIRHVPDGKHVLFITDTHISSSAKKSTYLLDYVRKKLGINKVIFCGDCIDGYATKYEAARYVREYANEFFGAFGRDGIWVQGNHDANAPYVIVNDIDRSVGLIDNEVIYNSTIKNIEDFIVFDTEGIAKLEQVFSSAEISMMTYWMKMHYYVDDVKDEIRYIVLETGDNSPAAMLFGNVPLWLQLDFLASSLLTIPENYSCVVLAHMVGWQSTSNDATKYRPWFQNNDISAHLLEIVTAYRNKSSVTINCENFPFRTDAQLKAKQFFSLSGTSRTYDFSNVQGDGNIFINSGHWHFDMSFVFMENGSWQSTGDEEVCKVDEITENTDLSQTTGAILLWTNRDAYASPAAYKTKGSDDVKRIIMTNNTLSEHSFDVLTISNNHLYRTRFGAGSDRDFRL